jgi:hypothetical protein
MHSENPLAAGRACSRKNKKKRNRWQAAIDERKLQYAQQR